MSKQVPWILKPETMRVYTYQLLHKEKKEDREFDAPEFKVVKRWSTLLKQWQTLLILKLNLKYTNGVLRKQIQLLKEGLIYH